MRMRHILSRIAQENICHNCRSLSNGNIKPSRHAGFHPPIDLRGGGRLAHPALHRKLNFALRLKHAGWIGGSINVPLDQRGDNYIDAADATATGVWLDPAKAQVWVLAQLKGQGITMRAA